MSTRTKHGMSRTPTYVSWHAMLQRCLNRNMQAYKWYGALGITVCKRWMEFENFLFDMGERPEGFELDRIDVKDNYYPMNCRWVTKKENMRNRGITVKYTHAGQTKS